MHLGRTTAVVVSLVATFALGSTVGQAFADTGITSLATTPAGWPFVIEQTTTTNAITSGVVHQAIHFDTAGGPLKANVLSVDLTNSNVQVGAVLAQNQVYSSDETISSMAGRTGAVGGINGDFFELGASGRPENLVVSNGVVMQSPLPGGYAVVGITADKRITIGPETMGGTVTVTTAPYTPPPSGSSDAITPPSTPLSGTNSSSGGQTVTSSVYGAQTSSFPLVAVNRPSTENGGHLGLITPNMGSLVYVKSDTVAYLSPVSNAPTNTGYTVVRVQSGVNAIPKLTGQAVLVAGGGAAAQWLLHYVTQGSTVTINTQLSPDSGIVQAVGAGYQLLRNGQWYNDPHALAASLIYQKNPLTAVGVTRDGQHMFMVVFDGREVGQSSGLTYHQMASYLQSLGAWNAAVLDGGGSTEMVARLPGDTGVSVVNSPSDGQERHVADGLFVYSTEMQPGPINQIVINSGLPIAMLTGTKQSLSAYGLDAALNPSPGSIQWSVEPSTLARVQAGQLVALQAGSGKVVATAPNGVSNSVPLTVVTGPASLTLTPVDALLAPGEQLPISVNAFTAKGQPLAVQPSNLQWKVSPSSLGTVSVSGLFQAAQPASDGIYTTNSGTVTATMGSASASMPVTVGYDASLLNRMTTPTAWSTSTSSAGKLSFDKSMRAVAGDLGSMKISYNYPAGSGVEQTVFWPNASIAFGVDAAGEAPAALGFWLHGDHSHLQFAVCLTDQTGTRQTLYPFSVDFTGWRYMTIPLPPTMVAPVTINYLDLLVAHPSTALKGALYISDLEALYAPSSNLPAASFTAGAPSWLRQVTTPTKFQGPGPTIAMIGGTEITTSSPKSAGAQVLQQLVQDAKGRFGTPQPLKQQFEIQTLGDMVNQATVANMSALKSTLATARTPVRETVGTGETNGSAQAAAFIKAFGPTHYTYTVGQTQFIVLDDANGGISAADNRQSPNQTQFPWLVATLKASRAKVVAVVMNQPGYGATPGSHQSVISSNDALLLERLLGDYQRANSNQHVILLSEAGTHTSVRSFNQFGLDTSTGITNMFIPSMVNANASNPSPAYVLLHVDNQGNIQWTEVKKTAGQTSPSSRGSGGIHPKA